jgi:hypothetical protein
MNTSRFPGSLDPCSLPASVSKAIPRALAGTPRALGGLRVGQAADLRVPMPLLVRTGVSGKSVAAVIVKGGRATLVCSAGEPIKPRPARSVSVLTLRAKNSVRAGNCWCLCWRTAQLFHGKSTARQRGLHIGYAAGGRFTTSVLARIAPGDKLCVELAFGQFSPRGGHAGDFPGERHGLCSNQVDHRGRTQARHWPSDAALPGRAQPR